MHHTFRPLILALGADRLAVTLLLCGCPTMPADTGISANDEPCNPCYLTDAKNFQYEGSLDVDLAPVKEFGDIAISWHGITQSIRGETISPDDITQSWLVVLDGISPEETAQALANDTLGQDRVLLFATCSPTDQTCRLSQYNVFGSYVNPSQYLQQGLATWLVVLVTSDNEPQTMVFLDPRSDANAPGVRITDRTANLDTRVDLRSLEPIHVGPEPDITVDWTGLTLDALGNPWVSWQVDQLVLARYEVSLQELENRFFEIDALASASWSLDLAGETSASLSQVTGKEPFTGIHPGETWLLGLLCSTCQNPVPRFLTVLEGVP